eukprot:3998873-Amphidinium_carterae.1
MPHSVAPFTGRRQSWTFYRPKGWQQISQRLAEELQQLGFPVVAPPSPSLLTLPPPGLEQHSQHPAQLVYPTEQRLQQKQRQAEDKLKGIAPKKRAQQVEQHFDDLGTDLTGLNIRISESHYHGPLPFDSTDDEDPDVSTDLHFRTGRPAELTTSTQLFSDLAELSAYLATHKSKTSSQLDFMELCG